MVHGQRPVSGSVARAWTQTVDHRSDRTEDADAADVGQTDLTAIDDIYADMLPLQGRAVKQHIGPVPSCNQVMHDMAANVRTVLATPHAGKGWVADWLNSFLALIITHHARCAHLSLHCVKPHPSLDVNESKTIRLIRELMPRLGFLTITDGGTYKPTRPLRRRSRSMSRSLRRLSRSGSHGDLGAGPRHRHIITTTETPATPRHYEARRTSNAAGSFWLWRMDRGDHAKPMMVWLLMHDHVDAITTADLRNDLLPAAENATAPNLRRVAVLSLPHTQPRRRSSESARRKSDVGANHGRNEDQLLDVLISALDEMAASASLSAFRR